MQCDCGCVECTVVRSEDRVVENRTRSGLKPEDVRKPGTLAAPVARRRWVRKRWSCMRIATGIPLYGVDIRERDLPQETEQARALNFNKGCYVGQEIVERIRSRGDVHRKFTGFVGREREQDCAGNERSWPMGKKWAKLQRGSVAHVCWRATVALGYIRREIGVPGREVTIGGARANVIQLPVEIGALRREPDEAICSVREKIFNREGTRSFAKSAKRATVVRLDPSVLLDSQY